MGTEPEQARAIAREAIVFAYPMLFNYKTLWEHTQDPTSPGYVGGFGRYRHYARSFTSADVDIVTPNNDTPYSWAWFDLRREPVVLDVPAVHHDRYYVVQLWDLFTFNFGYVGVRATGFDAGRYLIAGPDWDGTAPAGINGVLRSETRIAGTLTRTALFGADDLPNVRDIQARYMIRPLSEFAAQRPPAQAPTLRFPPWHEQRALSAGFIGYLNFLLDLVAPRPDEASLYARFTEIGIGAGRHWDPAAVPPGTLAAIEAGLRDGLDDIAAKAARTTSSLGLFGSRDDLGEDYLTRAVAAQMGIYGQVAQEAVYGGSRLDAAGHELTADRRYVLRFEKDELPPARFFWSITMYNLPDRHLVANPIDRYSIGDRTPGIEYGPDGSLEIRLQSDPPADSTGRANWLPAPGQGPFTVIYRMYGPGPAAIDGTWTLPAIRPAS
jgi:hypothetical protein